MNRITLKHASALLAAFLCQGVQAEAIPLTVNHRVIASQQLGDGRTALTFELTASNDGIDPLTGVSLRLMPGSPLLIEDEELIALGALASGQSMLVSWSVNTRVSVDDRGVLFQQLRFGAEANDSMGELMTFPVDSTEEQP